MTDDLKSPAATAAERRLLELAQSVSMSRSRRTWYGRTDATVAADLREVLSALTRERTAREQAEKALDALKVENTQAHGTIWRLERDCTINNNALNLAIKNMEQAEAEARRLRDAFAEFSTITPGVQFMSGVATICWKHKDRTEHMSLFDIERLCTAIHSALAQPAGEAGKEEEEEV